MLILASVPGTVGTEGSLQVCRPDPMWEFIKRDIGMKVAALLLAVFLWVNVAERRPVELVTHIPIDYINMPVNITLATKVPTLAKVRVGGSGIFLRWRLKGIHAAVDLSAGEKGVVTHVLSSSEVVVPHDADVRVLEVVEPKAIKMELDALVSREILVRPVMTGVLASDRVVLGPPVVDPARAVVSGAERVLAGVGSIPTAPIDIGQLARKGRVTARLDLSELPPMSSAVEAVTVSARIEPRKDLGIPSVPVEAVGAAGFKAKFTPEHVDVVISGAASQIDSLNPQEAKLVIDVAGLAGGQTVLSALVELGQLRFRAEPAGGGSREDAPTVPARLESPFALEVVSLVPDQIGLVLR
jgi:YbbR domain-containing protein